MALVKKTMSDVDEGEHNQLVWLDLPSMYVPIIHCIQ